MGSLIKYYNIHTHRESDSPNIIQIVSLECSELQRTKEGKLFSVGIHPWRIPKNFEKVLIDLETLLKTNSSIIAIGEIGLDKCCETPFALQEAVFREQLQLAEEYKKPVIIHCVKAWQEIIVSKKDHQNQKWIIHSFNKNYEQAKSLLGNDFFLSFGTNILENSKISEALKQAPPDKIFLETDTSSEDIVELYKKAADIRQIKVEKLASLIEDNFRKVFGEKLINDKE